jgi:hypothetical protein
VGWSSAASLKRRYVLAFFRKLRPYCVGIEACVLSHHWSRELHTQRLDRINLNDFREFRPQAVRS